MMDIASLVASFEEALEEPKAAIIPKKLGSLPTRKISQPFDPIDNSHVSHVSRSKTIHLEFENDTGRENALFEAEQNLARSELLCETVGNVGSVGSVNEINAKPFPLENDLVGRVGRDWEPAGAPNPAPADPAALPSSDWWDGPAMAEVDALLAPAPPLATPLPISPAQVRAGVERELRDLASHGRTGPGALSDAIAITRAKIRNSPLLVEAQTGAGRCLVCEEAEVADRRFIPVLTGAPGRMHWIHLACHAEHSLRLAAKVDAIMSAAGFREEQHRGAA